MSNSKRNKQNILSIILLVLLLAIGGTLIAGIIVLQLRGELKTVLQIISDFVKTGGEYSVLMLFWVVLIPILLIVLLAMNIRRRKKLKEIEHIWQDAVKMVAEREEQRRIAEEAALEGRPRFKRLNRLEAKTITTDANAESISSLSELCEKFRSYAATQLGLYYSITDIREFISALAVSHIIILQGLSGTGKTSLAYAIGEFFGNPSTIIPVQPMWKERADLLGYYNEFTRKFNETELLQKLYEANRSEKIYFTVLDELNIARVEYYFADFLSLLELPNPESRYLDVVPDVWKNDPSGLKDGRIKLPENMWFIGTANNDDSTFALSDKVYDRAMVVNLDKKAEFDREGICFQQKQARLTMQEFEELILRERESYELTIRNERRLKALDGYLVENYRISFGNRIMKQIRSYVSVYIGCGGEELDALDDILCKKVFRKLETQNAAYFKSEAENLCGYLNELFDGGLKRCEEYIRRIAKSV